jgi:hypothetical protein
MEDNKSDLLGMHLDYDGGNMLKETVRWSRFLAIVGIIGLVIFVLAIMAAAPLMTNVVEQYFGFAGAALVGLSIVFLLVVLAVFVALVVTLYQFSALTRRGIQTQDQTIFNRGLNNLKTYFIISGILGILTLMSTIYTAVSSL